MQISQSTISYQSMNISTKHENSFESENVKPDMSLNARFVAHAFQSSEVSAGNASAQSALFDMVGNNDEIKDFLMGMEKEGVLSLKDLGYEGTPILELSSQEASALIAEDGFFSVENTSNRAADFVLSGAGDDVGMLQAGREGIIKGFEEAEKLWGGKLPDIAYETQQATLEKIDAKIQSLGANALNVAA